eukprot:33939_1
MPNSAEDGLRAEDIVKYVSCSSINLAHTAIRLIHALRHSVEAVDLGSGEQSGACKRALSDFVFGESAMNVLDILSKVQGGGQADLPPQRLSKPNNCRPMTSLPPDTLGCIFSFLKFRELCLLQRTSKSLHVLQTTTELWLDNCDYPNAEQSAAFAKFLELSEQNVFGQLRVLKTGCRFEPLHKKHILKSYPRLESVPFSISSGIFIWIKIRFEAGLQNLTDVKLSLTNHPMLIASLGPKLINEAFPNLESLHLCFMDYGHRLPEFISDTVKTLTGVRKLCLHIESDEEDRETNSNDLTRVLKAALTLQLEYLILSGELALDNKMCKILLKGLPKTVRLLSFELSGDLEDTVIHQLIAAISGCSVVSLEGLRIYDVHHKPAYPESQTTTLSYVYIDKLFLKEKMKLIDAMSEVQWPNLNSLSLELPEGMDVSALPRLASHIPNLDEIKLLGSIIAIDTLLTDLHHTLAFPKLTKLSIGLHSPYYSNPIVEYSVAQILQHMKELSLTFRGMNEQTEAMWQRLLQPTNFSAEKLTIDVYHSTVTRLGDSTWPNLKSFTCREATHVHDGEIEPDVTNFVSRLSSLEHLSVYGKLMYNFLMVPNTLPMLKTIHDKAQFVEFVKKQVQRSIGSIASGALQWCCSTTQSNQGQIMPLNEVRAKIAKCLD